MLRSLHPQVNRVVTLCVPSYGSPRGERYHPRKPVSIAIEQSPAGIIIADAPDVRIRMCNSAALGIRGPSETALENIPVELHPRRWQVFHPNGRPFTPTELPLSRAVLFGATSRNVDAIVRRTSGEDRRVLVNAAPVRDAEGKVTAGVSVFLDVTDMCAAQAESEDHRRQLMRADRMASLGTLVAGVAHEVNNPNTTIMLSAPEIATMIKDVVPALEAYCDEHNCEEVGQTALADFRDDAPALLDNISAASDRIRRIVAGLKRFASDEPPEEMHPLDVNEVVRSAVSLAANRIRLKTTAFSTNLTDELPAVMGSFQRLEQVVINVLVNAAEALTSSEQEIEIGTEAKVAGQIVCITVQDQGAGMDATAVNRATDPFFTTKRATGGSGLGLAICTRVIDEHGGKMAFRSTPGRGTTVTIELPSISTSESPV